MVLDHKQHSILLKSTLDRGNIQGRAACWKEFHRGDSKKERGVLYRRTSPRRVPLLHWNTHEVYTRHITTVAEGSEYLTYRNRSV